MSMHHVHIKYLFCHLPNQVHAQQLLLVTIFTKQLSVDSLIANAHSMFIGAHLRSPHPSRLAEYDGCSM
jgi:hypothetical protein